MSNTSSVTYSSKAAKMPGRTSEHYDALIRRLQATMSSSPSFSCQVQGRVFREFTVFHYAVSPVVEFDFQSLFHTRCYFAEQFRVRAKRCHEAAKACSTLRWQCGSAHCAGASPSTDA